MRLISDTQEAIRILTLAGEIDLHYAPILRTLLRQKTNVSSEALVLDLSRVAFIDSSGIAAIIEHLRSASRTSGIFCIGGMSPEVKEIFGVIHLEKAMPLYDSCDAALQAIEKDGIAAPASPLFAR